MSFTVTNSNIYTRCSLCFISAIAKTLSLTDNRYFAPPSGPIGARQFFKVQTRLTTLTKVTYESNSGAHLHRDVQPPTPLHLDFILFGILQVIFPGRDSQQLGTGWPQGQSRCVVVTGELKYQSIRLLRGQSMLQSIIMPMVKQSIISENFF